MWYFCLKSIDFRIRCRNDLSWGLNKGIHADLRQASLDVRQGRTLAAGFPWTSDKDARRGSASHVLQGDASKADRGAGSVGRVEKKEEKNPVLANNGPIWPLKTATWSPKPVEEAQGIRFYTGTLVKLQAASVVTAGWSKKKEKILYSLIMVRFDLWKWLRDRQSQPERLRGSRFTEGR